MTRRACAVIGIAWLLGCQPPAPDIIPDPSIEPRVPQRLAPRPRRHTETEVRRAAPGPKRPVRPPAVAHAAGWMPLAMTGIDRFARRYPSFDGRGVLIGILDTGVDPSAPGLQRTPAGRPKVLDIRDFSGEGRVGLDPLRAEVGDTLVIAGEVHVGAERIRAHAFTDRAWWVGRVLESELGAGLAGDLNGDGDAADTFGVVVVATSGGLAAFVDVEGDRSFHDDAPVRDYLVRRDVLVFGADAPPGRRLGVAVNLRDVDGAPVLTLVADTDGHGTHVAGIAAGHDIGDVTGFDGAAPGAQLLALKVTHNRRGGMTTSGAILGAMSYALDRARSWRMPLVLNLSYGIGNEREGRAVVDSAIDAFLTDHPDVVFLVSAGNDGPGLSTVGFPGSAQLAITVGAVYPRIFVGRQAVDAMATFSARGGELAKPDVVAPGVAYSTVAAWDVGEELKGGTSMAAPHVAGLAARLVSGAVQLERTWTAASIGGAIKRAANPVFAGSALDQGFGLPDLEQAWRLVDRELPLPRVTVALRGDDAATTGVLVREGIGDEDWTLQFDARLVDVAGPVTLSLRSDAEWLEHPREIEVTDTGGLIDVTVAAARFPSRPLATGTITATVASGGLPVFRIPVTIATPHDLAHAPLSERRLRIRAGTVARRLVSVPPDAGGLDVRVAMIDPRPGVDVFLYEPSGQPLHGQTEHHTAVGGQTGRERTVRVRGDDLGGGVFEVVVAATQREHGLVDLDVRLPDAAPPITVRGDTIIVPDTGLPTEVSVVGAQRTVALDGQGGDSAAVAIALPAWTSTVELDLRLPRDRWERFTDFRLALSRADGSPLGAWNLDYAHSRLAVPLLETGSAAAVWVTVLPAVTIPDDDFAWTVDLVVKALADSTVGLSPGSEAGTWVVERRDDLRAAWAPLVQVVVRSWDGAPSVRWVPAGQRARPLGREHMQRD